MSMQQFDEKAKEDLKKRLDDLIEKGRGKKNVLDYQEITDAFQDMKLDEEQLELVIQIIEKAEIDVLRVQEDEAPERELASIEDENSEETDIENIDLTIPDSVNIEDPVRMVRAVKYSVTTGFRIPFRLSVAIRHNAPRLEGVSTSRMTEEVNKILPEGFELAFDGQVLEIK